MLSTHRSAFRVHSFLSAPAAYEQADDEAGCRRDQKRLARILARVVLRLCGVLLVVNVAQALYLFADDETRAYLDRFGDPGRPEPAETAADKQSLASG